MSIKRYSVTELVKKARRGKEDVITVRDFAAKHCNGISSQAVYYAVENELVDAVKVDYTDNGKNPLAFVILTPKTLEYASTKGGNKAIMTT